MYVHTLHTYKLYVTGFWKTTQMVTQYLFHFIAPANIIAPMHYHTYIVSLPDLPN